MTLGERIQTKRKELGWSQENLADRLDVSRQTIYKWETDQATPELGKLIAMAELFETKVGWLIAEEEYEEEGEAYDRVLERLTEILNSSSKTAETLKAEAKKKNRLKYAGLGVLAIILLIGSGKVLNLERQYRNLEYAYQNNANYTQRAISQITNNVQSMLDEFNNITMNSEVELQGYDFNANTATYNVSVQPKTYSSGMTATLRVDALDEISYYETEEKDKVFTASVVVPLNASEAVIYVEFTSQGVSESRVLSTLYGLAESTWPLYDMVWSLESCLSADHTKFDDPNCEIYNYGYVWDRDGTLLPKIISEEVYLTEDGVKIATYEREEVAFKDQTQPIPDVAEQESAAPIHLIFRRPDKLRLDPTKTYEEHLVVKDEYGRTMEIIAKIDTFETLYY